MVLSQNHPRALVSGSVEVSCVALQLVGRVNHSRDAGRAAGSRTLIYAFFFFFFNGAWGHELSFEEQVSSRSCIERVERDSQAG